MNFIQKAERIVNPREIILMDYEKKRIKKITPNFEITLKVKVADGEPENCNLYINNSLIETYDSELNHINGLELAANMANSIIKGVMADAKIIQIYPN